MKWFTLSLLTVVFTVFAGTASAQVVTYEPAFPTIDDPITVYFHADEGNRGLQGFTGDVYAHTGVITSSSTSPSDWRYVKTNWGQNTPDTKLERIGPDLYRFHIEDIRAYYGIPVSEEVLRLAFVFRSADTSREGKDVGNADIFIDLFSSGVRVRMVEPATRPIDPVIANRDTTLHILAVAGPDTSIAFISLFVDGEEVSRVENDTLTYDLVLDAAGRLDVLAIAEDHSGDRDSSAFYVVRNPEIVDVPLPEGIQDGINVDQANPTSVTFSLFAPGKEFVYLIGDFTGWQVDTEYFLNRDSIRADSVRWWITLDNLDPDREYAFQYLVDGEIRVADPYSTQVLDPFNDAFITDDTYPDLKPYPTGLTEHAVSVFRTSTDEYEWEVEDFERPPQHELVIYELLLRDFLAAHDFKTLIDTLDYLDRLGVNAIELMPVAEFDGNSSWGYNPAFHLAVDKYYGPADDLKRFVDEAHRRGIAVILDVVYNHMTGAAPFVRLYNDGDYGAPTPDNPWVNRTARHPFNVFNDVNHESTGTQYWLDRANAYWLEEFRVDGFRFDLSKGFTQTFTGNDVGQWGAYDASRVRLLKRMADRIWEIDPKAYVILEHFAENREEKELAEYRTDEELPGMMLWGNLNAAYNEATMGWHDNGISDLSGGYYRARGWTVPNLITYMESHDEQRLMFKNLRFGNRRGDYDVKQLPIALDRMKMAGAFFFTIPGPKMMWQFGELGYDVDIEFNGRTGEKPPAWGHLNDPLRVKLYKTWQALLTLRNENEVFRSPETEVTQRVRGAVKSIVLTHPTMDAVIVGNFGVDSLSTTLEFPATGTWYSYFSGDTLEVAEEEVSFRLAPGEFYIYTSLPVGSPEEGLITVGVDEEVGSEVPEAFVLHQNYPNPFNPTTTIAFSVPEAGRVKIDVFDLTGRLVATVVDGVYLPGSHTVTFDARNLSSGVYLYRLQSGTQVITQKMTLVK